MQIRKKPVSNVPSVKSGARPIKGGSVRPVKSANVRKPKK